jgi:hypothetical protein
VVKGPIDTVSHEPHGCFAARALHGFLTNRLDESQTSEPISCFSDCPNTAEPDHDFTPISDTVFAPVSSAPAPTPNSVQAPGPTLNLATISDAGAFLAPISDAASASLRNSTPEPSNHASFPLLGTHGEPQSPLFFPDSPRSPVSDLLSEPWPLTFPTWKADLEFNIQRSDSEKEFYLEAPDVATAAKALIEFMVAEYSGEKLTRTQRRALNVKIPPRSSIAGLFFEEGITFFM